MKKNLYLYLFIFVLLINIFTYVYFTKQVQYDAEKTETLKKEVATLKDSLFMVNAKLEDADYFSLQADYNAKEYYAGQDLEAIAIKLRDDIYAKNVNKGGNPLVPYPQLGDKPFTINRLKVLNNRWIIADFTNGKNWGQVLLKYFLEDDGSVTYENAETLLYTNTY